MIPQPKAGNKLRSRRTNKNKSRNRKRIKRPALDPARIYTRPEAALALGVSLNTVIRARDAGQLAELRAGYRVLHSGQQLLDWLAAGGKTI